MNPACWSWAVPGEPDFETELAAAIAANELEVGDDRDDDPAATLRFNMASPQRYRWDQFHSERCAVCGRTPRRLMVDHDHGSGLVRGLLCQSCNLREGHGWDGVFDAYRQRPPAAILGYRGYYVGFTWVPRWWENATLGRMLTGDPRWERLEGVGRG